MRYIVAPVTRFESGDLTIDKTRIERVKDFDGINPEPGIALAVWEYSTADQMSTKDARTWIEMTNPDAIYVQSSWGELIRAASHYTAQMEMD